MIAIVNYGVGNLRAFANILKNLGLEHAIVESEAELRKATKIIMPGVGAFDSVMQKLSASGLKETLNDLVLGKKIPVLGVCVGMQILAKSSEEGRMPGLGWIDANVKRFQSETLSIPQIGWNEAMNRTNTGLFSDLGDTPLFYFLHSYYMECNDQKDILAETLYAGKFTCAVGHENIFGVQFHPEKSHHNGVQLIRNFCGI